MVSVRKWKEIEQGFSDTLILGNGASVAVDKSFLYKSLLDVAKKQGFITLPVQNVFAHLGTQDFEYVLRGLANTQYINTCLQIKEKRTTAAYNNVREALVKAVHYVHSPYGKAKNYLPSIAEFMKRFKTVFSLNYDLLVYWAMLEGNRLWRQKWLKDCFDKGVFQDDFEFYRKPYRNAMGATLIFYPHGNLILATMIDMLGVETKITKDEYLLDTIVAKWQTGKLTPLFVSEGSNEQKLQAIRRNGYLRTVYNSALMHLNDSLVVYGWSMGKQDAHILSAIGQGSIKRIAVSVDLRSNTWQEFCEVVTKRVKATRGLESVQILFFDSESEECWVKKTVLQNERA